MKFRSETERMIYAAVFANAYERGAGRWTDNTATERAIGESEWAVECHRRAVRERKQWDT